jgi:peptide/nickel transport system substrate-binding protein
MLRERWARVSRRRLGGVVVGVVLVLGLGPATPGCSDGSPEAEPPPPPTDPGPTNGGRLVFALASAPGDLDPAGPRWSPTELQVARTIYDRLAVYDDNYQLRPELAESIEPNDDFTQWVVRLRADVYFHDGTPLDSGVVEQHLEAQRRSPFTQALFSPVDSISTLGPRMVRIQMRSSWSTFPHLLTGQPGYVALRSEGAPGESGPRPLIGTGPFTVAEQAGGGLTVAKSSTYWLDGLPRLDGVDFQVIPDEEERRKALESGRVDVAFTDDAAQIEALREAADEQRLQVVDDLEDEDPKLTIVLNTARPPFLDPTARRAVNLSTDRRAFDTLRYDGLLPPARSPFSEQSLWYNHVPVAPHDLAEAQRELEEYRQTYGTGLTFTLAVPPDSPSLRFAAAWQRQLAETGIAVLVVIQPLEQIRLTAASGDFQAVMLPMFDAWHPDWHYSKFHQAYLSPVGAPGANYPRFGDDAIDETLDSARQTGELAEQVNQYRVMQDELSTGEAYLFLARLRRALAAVPDVRDLTQWTTASGGPGLAVQGGTVSLTSVWLARAERPAE